MWKPNTADYRYDGHDQRVAKTLNGQTTSFHYDPAGHLIAESNAQGLPLREYVYLDDLPLALLTSGQTYFIHPDHLGTPQVFTDAAQQVAWSADSQPFGELALTSAAVDHPLRFPGQYYDAESGLHYNYFRDYDPQTGRYIQSDPIGLAGGINTFAYVGNDPVNWSDPYGLQSTTLPGAGPLIIPPIAKPGSPENTDFVETISNILPNTISVECRGRLCLPTAKGDNGSDDVDGPMEMSKGGKQNIDNEYTREVKNLGSQCQNPCEYLRDKYNKETNSNERLKIKAAMKYFNCDGKNRYK